MLLYLIVTYVRQLFVADDLGAVTYYRKKVTDAERTEKCEKCLFGGGSCLGGNESRHRSRKERIRTQQVTDKDGSTNVNVPDV